MKYILAQSTTVKFSKLRPLWKWQGSIIVDLIPPNEHEGRRKKDDEEEEDEIDANTFWPSQRWPCQAGGKA